MHRDMSSTATDRITIEYTPDLFEVGTAYATISALVDMAMTSAGASIAELDLCDSALRELLTALGSDGPVVSASISLELSELELTMGSPIGPFEAASRELLDLGFRSFDVVGSRIRCRFAPASGAP